MLLLEKSFWLAALKLSATKKKGGSFLRLLLRNLSAYRVHIFMEDLHPPLGTALYFIIPKRIVTPKSVDNEIVKYHRMD